MLCSADTIVLAEVLFWVGFIEFVNECFYIGPTFQEFAKAGDVCLQ